MRLPHTEPASAAVHGRATPRPLLTRPPTPRAVFRFSNAWTTDLVEAKTLAMFAYMLKAKRVMEIGMFTGYGALSVAEVLPADGKMVTCEIDPFLAEFSRPFFDRSPHGSKIEVRLGSAIESMLKFDVKVGAIRPPSPRLALHASPPAARRRFGHRLPSPPCRARPCPARVEDACSRAPAAAGAGRRRRAST